MKMKFKKIAVALCIAGGFSAAHAEVCNNVPGTVICGSGTIENLMGNGTVTVNGSTVLNATQVNGVLKAENANFHLLDVNGSTTLTQCNVSDVATIKGSLTAASTKFERGVNIFSNNTRLISSKVRGDIHIGHIEPSKQIVYLDNSSEVSGNIIFDDGNGEVYLRGQSKIAGKVIGGHTIFNNK